MRERTFSWLRQPLLSQSTQIIIAALSSYRSSAEFLPNFPQEPLITLLISGHSESPGSERQQPQVLTAAAGSLHCRLSASELLHDLAAVTSQGSVTSNQASRNELPFFFYSI